MINILGGIVGINPDPSRFSFHVGKIRQQSGSIAFSDIMQAADNCVKAGANIISMALSCLYDETGQGCYNEAYEQQFQSIYDQGVLIIGGAGNTANSSDEYPGSYKTVMSVSALGANNLWFQVSTRNAQVEISAPGV